MQEIGVKSIFHRSNCTAIERQGGNMTKIDGYSPRTREQSESHL